MSSNLRELIAGYYNNLKGWRTKKKIIVIESDDWGSLRMPNLEVFEKLTNFGIGMDKNPLDRIDTLETSEDLYELYRVLSQFKDVEGNHPIITANYVTANPDFDRILESEFTKYYYQTVLDTYDQYNQADSTFLVVKRGIDDGYICPQYHGREHLNVDLWMQLLRNGHTLLREAFTHKVFSIPIREEYTNRQNLMAAYDLPFEKSIEEYKREIAAIFLEGIDLFENIFGHKPVSFIAPCYIWPRFIEEIAGENGIKFIQGGKYRLDPMEQRSVYLKKRRYLGQHVTPKTISIVRNVFLEPSLGGHKNWVNTALIKVKAAFDLGKPAIVSMHRANFVGSNEPGNRRNGLAKLEEFLGKTIERWPDVHFMSTASLGQLIQNR